MPDDFDPDAYLSKREQGSPQQQQQPAFDPDAYLKNRARTQHPWLAAASDAGKGIAKNVAADVVATRDMGSALGGLNLGPISAPMTLAGLIPQGAMQTIAEFANSPSKSMAETAGYYGTDVAEMLAAPEMGVAKAAEWAAPGIVKSIPYVATAADLFHSGGTIADLFLWPSLKWLAGKAAPYAGPAARIGGLAVEKTVPPGVAREGASIAGGGDNGRSGTPGPAGPAPAPSSVGNARPAGGEGERDNLPPKNQRAHRSWSNLDYYRDAEEGKGP